MRSAFAFLLLAALSLPLVAQSVDIAPSTPAGHVLMQLVETSRMDELRWPDFSDYRKHLRNFYAPLGYPLVWTRGGKPTPQARAVIALFEAADAKGIHATDYDSGRWSARLAAAERAGEPELARFDMAVSITLMRYISDLHIGRINPRHLRFQLDVEGKKYYLPSLLMQIKDAPDPAAILATVEPPYAEYRRLQAALASYRAQAAAAGNEPPLPVVKKLQRGDAYAGLAQLIRMLRRGGDLAASVKVDPKLYDGAVVDAVKRFQSRHGLSADGVISAKTFAALNVPAGYRVKQIEWALERWRWAPYEFSAPPIVVNVPEFILRAWDETAKTALTMRVVVGQAYGHETPIFEDEMTYLVFRPYWSVPPGIQRKELAPKAERDPSFLARNRYEVVSGYDQPVEGPITPEVLAKLRTLEYQLRQKPGPSNALGLIKFIFPNRHNVYFHSTPAQELFSRSRRDFSHGCIRLEDPVALAAWVLRDRPEWTATTIEQAMKSGPDNQTIVLSKPIPILIIYTTAAVAEDGRVFFFDDVYGHDEELEEALGLGYPYPG